MIVIATRIIAGSRYAHEMRYEKKKAFVKMPCAPRTINLKNREG
jgi:hypothetical protein